MRNWRKTAGALCIVLAMMLGAFAGFAYARNAGNVGVSPDAGTRSTGSPPVPTTNALAKGAIVDGPATSEQTSFGSSPTEVKATDGTVTAKQVTADEQKAALLTAPQTILSKDGAITISRDTGTRYSGPGINAGGPYGGTDTFEGGPPITFTVTAYDPSIIFFRWDFNGDGVWDYPDQAGGGSIGKWTTEMSVQKQFFDNYYTTVTVEGWDGISTNVFFNTGNNFGEGTSPYWYMYPMNYGFEFTPKNDFVVTQLGWYQWFNLASYGGEVRIWDTATQSTIARAVMPGTTYSWVWVTLSSPVTLIGAHQYRLVEHRTNNYYPYTMAWYGPPGAMPPYSPPIPEKITVGNSFYNWGPAYTYPTNDDGTFALVMADFKWEETLIIPDTTQASTTLQVMNVAPTVFGVTTDPSPALEGSMANFVAQFSDPGLDDTWTYRWSFADGTQSPWLPVTKMNGGARVLMLDTYYDQSQAFLDAVKKACGAFCIQIDHFEFDDQVGEGRAPTAAELAPYNVLVVGTNVFAYYGTDAVGNAMADFMDKGGGVVVMQAGFDSAYGCQAGICGRWESDEYSPIPRGGIDSGASMGSIYVPGHPLLDGISSVSTSWGNAMVYDTTAGAERIVDWNSGMVFIATKENPKVPNGARAVALNMFPIYGYAGGDYIQLIVNSIRWSSRQPDPTLKPMPITLDAYQKSFADDNPTTTPEDTYPVSVEVQDDDNGKLQVTGSQQLDFQNFEIASQCNGQYYTTTVWPPGWSSNPNPYGWTCGANSYGQGRSPYIYYYFNDYDTSYLYTPTYDLSSFLGVRLDMYMYWEANYPGGDQTGLVEASFDGGATWPVLVAGWYHNNPGHLQGDVSVENFEVGAQSSVMFRYAYISANDWWWAIDNVRFTGESGYFMEGLGSADGFATIANVPPTIAGGFDSAMRDEAQGLLFSGFKISDPALIQPTEWFAYRMNFDDGTPDPWVYMGSLAPPRYSILILHSFCLGGIYSTCTEYNALRNLLLAQDDVASVDGWNYLNYAGTYIPTAPPLSTLMNYDLVIFTSYYGYMGYTPWDQARRTVGDRLADYVDSGRGAVLTMMSTYGLSVGNPSWTLTGRYANDQYGPMGKPVTRFEAGAPGPLTLIDPNHPIFDNMGTDVSTTFDHDGTDLKLSVGADGRNNAAGTNGILLAKWSDGSPAVSVKTLLNGVRTVHFGGFAVMNGADAGMLLRNMVGWALGGLPSPKIPDTTHVYGDNGVYTVDFTVIDDDMGYVWDFANNQPTVVIPGIAMSHRYVSVAVNNVDPTIDASSIQAFIAAEMCLRVSGSRDNTVTVDFYTDGVLSGTTTVTRLGSSPNPYIEKCGLLKIDVLAPHDYSAVLSYNAPGGGSNPTWLIIEPWREPVTPGHGTVTYKYDLDKMGGTINVPLSNLKGDLIAGGEGAKIDFSAVASDPGTDDLAFFWTWGTVLDSPYDMSPTSVYTIHVHHNDGSGTTDGVLTDPEHLGFSEPYFDQAANTGRSPAGTMPFQARDTAVHAFDGTQRYYYVTLIVLDDDNSRAYPSPFGHSGTDMEFVVVDLG